MTEQAKRTLEICFFILAAMMLVKPPAEIMTYLSTNLSTSAVAWFASPAFVVFVVACAVMVTVSVLRLIKHGKFFANLIAGVVYFMNIIMWIEVI